MYNRSSTYLFYLNETFVSFYQLLPKIIFNFLNLHWSTLESPRLWDLFLGYTWVRYVLLVCGFFSLNMTSSRFTHLAEYGKMSFCKNLSIISLFTYVTFSSFTVWWCSRSILQLVYYAMNMNMKMAVLHTDCISSR